MKKITNAPKVNNKKFTKRYLRVFSRHPSHNVLRDKVLLPKLTAIRFGSTSESNAEIQINSIQAIKNSSSKLLMKQCFDEKQVKTAQWWTAAEIQQENKVELPYPLVAKLIFGSRGEGMKLINTEAELNTVLNNHPERYIFEKYYSFSREYRLHVTKQGCFYTNRKLLKENTPEDKRWYRNDSNCTWVLETNPAFNKPNNWNLIEQEAVKALNAVGLDIGAVDLRTQANDTPEFFIIEINSAPSFGNITEEKYLAQIPKIYATKIA